MSADAEVLWLDEHRVVSLRELQEISGLAEAELLELVQAGLIPVRDTAGETWTFSASVITVARTASRLRNDFELDTPGLALALKLLERVRDLEQELARARVLLPRAD